MTLCKERCSGDVGKSIVEIIQLQLEISKFRKFKIADIIEMLNRANNIYQKADCLIYAYKDKLIFICHGQKKACKKTGLIFLTNEGCYGKYSKLL